MRATIALLAAAALVVAVLAACRARDHSAADTAAGDSTDGSETDSAAAANDTASSSASIPRRKAPRASRPDVRRADDTARDSTLPPEDSIRAMRPRMPQVTPVKRPRAWRGFKLPEEQPVRLPLDTIRRVDQAADSVMKGDSTKPPRPNR